MFVPLRGHKDGVSIQNSINLDNTIQRIKERTNEKQQRPDSWKGCL